MSTCPLCFSQWSESVGQSRAQLPCDANTNAHKCNPCASVADIDAKIEQTRQNLTEMQAERVRLLSEVNQAHDRLTQQLPIEIMSSIFQHCLSDLDTLKGSPDGWMTSVPLRLSQVSRRWRTICHSTPQLWAILALHVKEWQGMSLEAISDVLQEWLARSGERYPLDIILDIGSKVDLQSRYCHSIFATLSKYVARVRHFQIKAAPKILRHLCHLDGDITTLQISCVQEMYWSEPTFHLRSGCGTVAPERLYFDGSSLNGFHFSVKNLTHLEMRMTPFWDMFTLLRSAPHLVSCSFTRPKDRTAPPVPVGYLVKPTLRHLRLYNRVQTQLSTFILAIFTFPSLQSLRLEGAGGQTIPLNVVIDNLLRNDSKLEKLSLRGLETHDMAESLARLIGPVAGQGLQHLEIAGNRGWDTMEVTQQVASIVESSSAYLQNLRTLRLYCGEQGWVHTLQRLLSTSRAITSKQPLSINICFKKLPAPIDKDTQTSELYPMYDGSPLPAATDLREMMHTMKDQFISVVISFRPGPDFYAEDAQSARDITEEILVTLARLLHKSRNHGQLYRSEWII